MNPVICDSELEIEKINTRMNVRAMDDLETFVMRNCRQMLAAAAATAAATVGGGGGEEVRGGGGGGRMFGCKTCGKKFNSFQALGGHRASHRRIRTESLIGAGDTAEKTVKKPKSHACSICGDVFPIGQALGGHMRRHRPVTSAVVAAASSTVTAEGSFESSDATNSKNEARKRKIENENDVVLGGIVKKKVKREEQVCLDLGLFFTPIKEEKEKEIEIEEIQGSELIEEGEIVEQEAKEEEEIDFLKLELRQPIREEHY